MSFAVLCKCVSAGIISEQQLCFLCD